MTLCCRAPLSPKFVRTDGWSGMLMTAPQGPLLRATRFEARVEQPQSWLLVHMDGLCTPYHRSGALLWMSGPEPAPQWHAIWPGLTPAPQGPLLGATRYEARVERPQSWLLVHMDGLRTPHHRSCALLWMSGPQPAPQWHAVWSGMLMTAPQGPLLGATRYEARVERPQSWLVILATSSLPCMPALQRAWPRRRQPLLRLRALGRSR